MPTGRFSLVSISCNVYLLSERPRHTPALCFMISFSARFSPLLPPVSLQFVRTRERGNGERSHGLRVEGKNRKNSSTARLPSMIFGLPSLVTGANRSRRDQSLSDSRSVLASSLETRSSTCLRVLIETISMIVLIAGNYSVAPTAKHGPNRGLA